MSFRFLTQRLFRHGRLLIQHYCRRDIHQGKILDNQPTKDVAGSLKRAQELAQQTVRSQSIFRFGNQARRLFVDNLIGRATNPVSANLRAEANRKFLTGDSVPFLSLLGVSLATGSGFVTRDDELEGVCYEIREVVQRFQHLWAEKELNENFTEDLSLNDLSVGPPIAKGCSAVVYAAKFKEDAVHSSASMSELDEEPMLPSVEDPPQMPQVQNISRFIHNYGSVDNVYESTIDHIQETIEEDRKSREVRFNSRVSRHSISSWGSSEVFVEDDEDPSILNYPLALKIMFNYDIESNAMSILRAMHKETVPARRRNFEDISEWERNVMRDTVYLPPHPNVVAIYGVFCDRMPKLRDASRLFPMALPPRLNPDGYGRNMSLFLLMKRYETNLKDFLGIEMDMRDRILLFAQLLEAVTHLNISGIAHRDLKSDNILIELNEDSAPVLVLSDFGCCIADRRHGLRVPYSSGEIDKGGNTALMAPEIIMKQPGLLASLDYTKADLWACGAIAYEIFGQGNPFYANESSNALKSHSYAEEQLPELNGEVPGVIKALVANILQRNPRKRVSAEIAANVVQLYLWAPSRWLYQHKMPSSNEILQWLLSLTTKTLCETRTPTANLARSGRRTHTEYLLISSFLARAQLSKIRSAFKWIHDEIQPILF